MGIDKQAKGKLGTIGRVSAIPAGSEPQVKFSELAKKG
jgi:hypothetical protein